jgi:predicted DNA-binding transcriptional regulator AlpA
MNWSEDAMSRKVGDGCAFPQLCPRGLRRAAAAAYIGTGCSKFDELVADGRMPKPKHVDGCVIWDRYELDQSFDALGNSESVNPWDEVED